MLEHGVGSSWSTDLTSCSRKGTDWPVTKASKLGQDIILGKKTYNYITEGCRLGPEEKGHLICYSKSNEASGTEEEGVQARMGGNKFKSLPGAMM